MRQQCDGLDQVLAVIKNQQKPAPTQRRDDALLDGQAGLLRDAERPGHGVAGRSRVTDSGKLDEPSAVRVFRREFSGNL